MRQTGVYPMALVASASKDLRNRYLIVVAMCVVFAVWFDEPASSPDAHLTYFSLAGMADGWGSPETLWVLWAHRP